MTYAEAKQRARDRAIEYHRPAADGKFSPFCADILQQEHVLIAGTTGSGKSVLINAIIFNALYMAPEDVQFILIDPKRTELREYKNLPHVVEYASQPEDCIAALDRALEIMNAREERAERKNLRRSDEAHLYIIIDELSDLIYTDRTVIRTLARLAMRARSSNIHLICATQCPNRKTIPAEINANLTARVGLRCSDAQESKQVIKSNLCTTLPRYGSCYYMTPDTLNKPVRKSVPFYTDAELTARADYWREQKARRKAYTEEVTARYLATHRPPAQPEPQQVPTEHKRRWRLFGGKD